MGTATAKAAKPKVKKLKYEALGNRVVVRLIPAEERSPGGIIIPTAAQRRPEEGEIMDVGPGKRLQNGDLIPSGLKKGDHVLIVKYGGAEIKINGVDMLVLDADTEIFLRLT